MHVCVCMWVKAQWVGVCTHICLYVPVLVLYCLNVAEYTNIISHLIVSPLAKVSFRTTPSLPLTAHNEHDSTPSRQTNC